MPDIFRMPNGHLVMGGYLLRVDHNKDRSGGVLRVLPITLMTVSHKLSKDVKTTTAVLQNTGLQLYVLVESPTMPEELRTKPPAERIHRTQYAPFTFGNMVGMELENGGICRIGKQLEPVYPRIKLTPAKDSKAIVAANVELRDHLYDLLQLIGVPRENLLAVVSRVVTGLSNAR